MLTTVKERPILFSAPMVRAILEGRKTQTRRIIKPQPDVKQIDGFDYQSLCWGPRLNIGPVGEERTEKALRRVLPDLCPYGNPGDRLWVRETHAFVTCAQDDKGAFYGDEHDIYSDYGDWFRVYYHADPGPIPHDPPILRPSIHMPRWASRILLEVTGVRVERLQDISEEDAIAEGLFNEPIRGDAWGWEPFTTNLKTLLTNRWNTPQNAYRALWESINGPGSWDVNPWVWVVEFKRVDAAQEGGR